MTDEQGAMGEGMDREFLLSVFLMEAWDAVATLEASVPRLTLAPETEDAIIVAHRLRGAAALHGFPLLSALAATMEELIEAAAPKPPAEREAEAKQLGGLLGVLRAALDTIASRGEEDAAAIDAALGGASASREAASADAPSAPDEPSAPAGPALALAVTPTDVPAPAPASATDVTETEAELARFFSENADVLEYFAVEAGEHLDAIAASVLALERSGPNADEVRSLFRAVHTLKGAAYTVGCRPMGDLAHRVEDLLAAVRDGQAPLTPALLEAVQASADALRLMLRAGDGPQRGLARALAHAQSLLDAVDPSGAAPAEGEANGRAEDRPAAAEAPEAGQAEAKPTAPPAPPARPAAAPGGRGSRGTVRVAIERLDAIMNMVGELVSTRTRLERRLAQLDHVGEALMFTQRRLARVVGDFERKYLDPRLPLEQVADARPDDALLGGGTPLADVFDDLEFDRYDDFNILARSVAELSTDVAEIQGQLAGLVRGVRVDAARVQGLTADLRAEVTRARLVPIGRLFARFDRQVREAARVTGKQVSLEISGEGVAVDTTIVEQVADPLLHIVQNAVVHGLEMPEERRRRGKPERGILRVTAVQQGGAVTIEVADDGAGIDIERVRRVAVARGFLTPAAAADLSPRQVIDLIFLPGFSTAEKLTTAAGRGVGMDVVRTNVARVGGEIDVETEAGQGTRFVIRLPLTVAITDAFTVRVGPELLAVPVTAVKTVVPFRVDDVQATASGPAFLVEGELLDLVRLHDVLALPAPVPGDPLAVLAVRAGRRGLALVVDEVLAKEEVVVKPLGAFLEGAGPYAGATISPEGRVVLLLDAMRLGDAGARSGEVAGAADRARRERAARTPRVMLVDDSISVRKYVGQMLQRAGYEVITANDGAEALERLAEVRVDALITDLEMPRVNGYELIRDLRRRAATRDLPAAVLTTRVGAKHASLARDLGVTHYLPKPVDEATLVQIVESLLGLRAGAGADGR